MAGKPYKSSPKRLSCRHIIPCAGESGACVFYPRPVWPRSGRRQNNTPGWSWEDTASRIPGIFSGAGKYHFPSELLPEPVQPAAQTAQNTGKGRRSTIYEAYSRGSPGEGRAFPARHSWRISLLPAFGSLRARSGSAPAAGRSFPPSPPLRKFQLEIHILFACIFPPPARRIALTPAGSGPDGTRIKSASAGFAITRDDMSAT